MKNIKRVLMTMALLTFYFLFNCEATNGQNSISTIAPKEQTSVPDRKIGFNLDKSNDTKLKSLLSETVNKFVQLEYQDSVTGKKMSYNLFVPLGFDKKNSIP